jgi:peptidoglycan hydrolase-like protein with peptidoglycan-binding domain
VAQNSRVNTPLGRIVPLPFPGRIIKVGDPDRKIVKAIQHRLNEVGCGPVKETGVFDNEKTKNAVKLFQARFPDASGLPLHVDGKVGPLTWGAMFGFVLRVLIHGVIPVIALLGAQFPQTVRQIFSWLSVFEGKGG